MIPRSPSVRRFRTLLVACLLVLPALAHAQSTLSGSVFGGGSPLQNALVEALDDGTTNVAASSTTNAAGQYSLSLPDATYDLRVTPPSGTNFNQELIQNVVLNGDRNYDIILIAVGNSKVYGTVRGRNGDPVPNANAYFYSSNWNYLTSATTDSNGYYEAVVNGNLNIQFAGGSSGVPAGWSAYRYGVPVTSNTQLDVNVPTAQLSGTVADASSTPVAGATIEVYGYAYDSTWQLNFNYSTTRTTDSAGHYELLALNGTNNATVRPPAGSGLTIVTESFSVSGDTTKDFTLAAAPVLSGTVRGYGGAAVGGAYVTLYTSNWQFVSQTTTDSAGYYSVPAILGSTIVVYSGSSASSSVVPNSWSAYRYDLVLSSSTTVDVSLPVSLMSGKITDPTATGVAGVTFEGNGYNSQSPFQFYYSFSGVATDANGDYSALLFDGTTNLTLRPPQSTGLAPISTSFTVSGDHTRNFQLAQASTISGTIRGYGGNPVPNANITIYNTSWQWLASSSSDASGYYTVPVGSDPMIVYWSGSGTSNVAPDSWSTYRYNVTVPSSITIDLDLPVAKIDGTTTDSNGAPVPNVQLEVYSSSYDSSTETYASGYANKSSGAAGEYTMLLMNGSLNFTVRPPLTSGFLTTQLFPTLSGDVTQRIVLQRPDLSPPQIIAGPVVVHVSDTSSSISWTTDEPSTSVIDYGVGSFTSTTSTPGMVTNHIVTIQGLSPLTTYDFRVNSTDPAGNGPTSANGSFTTLAAPDVTAPQIVSGPTVVFVDQTTAIVQWETDEPASSSIAYGTGSLDSTLSGPAGVFTTSHSMTITGLTALTTYNAQVTSADPSGNSTSSSQFSFTTLAEPDTAPPIITSGPTIVSATDTQVVVQWTTNEPATSGVSYNDGTQFFVVTDNTLTSTHQVTLSNLSPATAYQITVSSTDAVGNGPTLGGPITGTTDDEPDTTAPVISNLQVTQITETSAVITFTTDEPATIVLNYGINAGALDQTKADLSPSTSHSMTLNGLNDGTQYFFTVQATDSSSNSATVGPYDFTTESSHDDQPPTPPGPITGPPSPSNAAAFDLTWGASTDDGVLMGYQVILDGTAVASYDAFTTTHAVADLAEGQHTFVVRASDNAGQTADSAPFTITIDRTAPAFETPGSITAGTQGNSAIVDYEVSVSDNLDAGVIAACVPPSGSSFPIGDTEVVCTAYDAAGNRGEASFTVTIEDDGAPSLVVPADQTLEAFGNGGAVATFTATASDAVDGVITPVCIPASGSFFPVGPTLVSCTATDTAGNEAAGSFTITVVDTKAPAIASIAPSQASLWPPNHQMVNLSVAVSVSDLGDAAPVCRISSVSSNEPVNGLGDGDSSPDWMNASGLTLSLRAERGGKGNGRIYTIVVTCQDASGNASTASTAVTVPKNQSGK